MAEQYDEFDDFKPDIVLGHNQVDLVRFEAMSEIEKMPL